MAVTHRFLRRAPFDKDWSDVDDVDNDPICQAMNAVNTNYLQYTVPVEQAEPRKRGQMRYFRESVYVNED